MGLGSPSLSVSVHCTHTLAVASGGWGRGGEGRLCPLTLHLAM